MPMAQARRLCPQAVFLPTDMKRYTAVHHELLELFGRFTDLVEPVSIDEAVLDVAGSRRLFGPPRAIAGRIQELVYDEHGLTCTLGVAPNKLLAKLAANLNKPAGIGVLNEADVHGRLRALPVGELFGVGPVTQERLHALGLTTVGMLQDVPLPFLAAAFGRARAAAQAARLRAQPVARAARRRGALVHEPRDHLRHRHRRAARPARHAAGADRRARGAAARAALRGAHRGAQGARQHLPHARAAPHPAARHHEHPRPSTLPPPACSTSVDLGPAARPSAGRHA